MSRSITRVERRAFGRRRSCIHAFALVPGRPPAPCIVRNFSPKGAMLELNELLVPSFNFRLRIGTTGDEIDCEVRHVRDYRIGVIFRGEGIAERLEQAFGARVKVRRRRGRGRSAVDMPPVEPARRLTGQELRRTVLGHE